MIRCRGGIKLRYGKRREGSCNGEKKKFLFEHVWFRWDSGNNVESLTIWKYK